MGGGLIFSLKIIQTYFSNHTNEKCHWSETIPGLTGRVINLKSRSHVFTWRVHLRLETRSPNSQALPTPPFLLFQLLSPLFSLESQDKTCVLATCFYQCIRKQGSELWNILPLLLSWCCWGLLYLSLDAGKNESGGKRWSYQNCCCKPKCPLYAALSEWFGHVGPMGEATVQGRSRWAEMLLFVRRAIEGRRNDKVWLCSSPPPCNCCRYLKPNIAPFSSAHSERRGREGTELRECPALCQSFCLQMEFPRMAFSHCGFWKIKPWCSYSRGTFLEKYSTFGL